MTITASDVWEKYPYYVEQKAGGGQYPNGKTTEDVWKQAGNNLYDNHMSGGAEYHNSCALRLSIALHNCLGNFDAIDGVTIRNVATNQRYIISAAFMHDFLKSKLGAPHGLLASGDRAALETLQQDIGPDTVVIACSDGHAALIKNDYADKYVPYGDMDYWIVS